MESIIENVIKDGYVKASCGFLILDIHKLELDLKNEYKVKFVQNKSANILLRYNFIREWTDHNGWRRLIIGQRLQMTHFMKFSNKEDTLKSIDVFFSNIIKSCIDLKVRDIKAFIINNHDIELTDEQIQFYIETINSDKELIRSLISERKNITSEVIKKVSNILNLDESETIILLAENGYKFKISDPKVQESIDIEIKSLISSDKIDYKKVINLCNIIN